MKLLKLKIETDGGFRSLPKDFEINFHKLANPKGMESFSPFCFAGLNGSGKSNVLEAISGIFYHLEFCVARYQPQNFKKHFRRETCTPDAFIIEYLIGQEDRKQYTFQYFDKVTIEKKAGHEPTMMIRSYPFDHTVEERKVSLLPSLSKQEPAEGKRYLPAHVIGYSSGENEILSLPFLKSRLVHLDEYKQATEDNYNNYEEPENSLIYIDNNMSQAVLLACLLFESNETLSPIRDVENTGISGIRSFRMNLNLHDFTFIDKKTKKEYTVPVLRLIEQNQIEKLKKCATSWFSDGETLWLDYYVDDATKAAFRYHFNNNAFQAFQLFRLLYELNAHFIDDKIIEGAYKSQGFYTDSKLPVGTAYQDVFHFLDFHIIKKLKGSKKEIDLLLRNFSDGEHQFLHTIGICLLLKDRKSILLLDEPETHFNPSWRARFIKVLSDSIEASRNGYKKGDKNIHLLKDILLTSHSPFIISDCVPENVILFKKGITNGVGTKTSKERGFNTYGASVDLILQEIFEMSHTISEHALEEIRILLRKRNSNLIIEGAAKLGESYEKGFLYARIEELNATKKKEKKK